MRTASILLVLTLSLPSGANAAAPALTVVISVDQMRADYMTRFGKEFTGGFARLARERRLHARASRSCPDRDAPGAALMTGAPSQHGIVGNEWWDKKEGRAIYAVEDAERWRGPVNLECPTLGDALKASSTASLVVSVSGKDRAAILMGGHKADLALWYDRSSGQFVTSGVYGRMPDWVWLWDDALRIPVDQREKIASTPRLDAMTLELAAKAIEQSRLGGRGVPDLLAISLSVTDILGHAYGPDSPQMREQLLALDKSLGAFFDGLDRRFGRDGYALALSADHGVTPLPEMSAAPGALRLISKGLERDLETALRAKLGAPPKAGASWVLDVHSPYVYLDLEAADRELVQGLGRPVEAASDCAEAALGGSYSAADRRETPDEPYVEVPAQLPRTIKRRWSSSSAA